MGVRRDWHGVLLMAAALSIASAKTTAGVFWHLYCAVCTSESPPQNWRHHVSFDVCHAGSQKSSHRCGRWTHTTSAVRVNYYREVSSDHVSLGKDSSKYCVFGWYYQIPPPTVSQMWRLFHCQSLWLFVCLTTSYRKVWGAGPKSRQYRWLDVHLWNQFHLDSKCLQFMYPLM